MATRRSEELPLIGEQQQQDKNTKTQTIIVKTIEVIRSVGTGIGIYFGFGSSPNYRLSASLLVFCLAGITGLESLFFGKISARAKKWGVGSPYEIQSAANNLASAVAMIILLSIGADDAAIAALMMTVTIFIMFSGLNHFVTVMIDKFNGKDIAKIHFIRIIFAIPVSVAVGFILGYWKPFLN